MRHVAKFALLGVALSLLGCPPPPPSCEEDDPTCFDAGQPPEDLCNSIDEALSLPECELKLAEGKEAYIGFSGDDDWYRVQMPGTLTARSLIHLTGGYSAPNTAVNLSLNLLREDGAQSLARKIDRHGQAAPKLIDVVLPFSEANATLLVLVQDEGAGLKPNFDAKNPYRVTIDVFENPDGNEPNDVTPTTVTLADQGGILVGQQTGYLATDGDVDQFAITVPAGRKVLYLHLSAPKKTPPPPYRLSYTLLDPAGTPIAEDRMDNEFLAIDLATARLTSAGGYTLVVQGYKSSSQTGPVAGDVNLQYTLDVKVMDEVDPTEPNDTSATARKATALTAPGSSQTFTGRLGFVPDPDWFEADLPANAAPTVLYFRVTPAGGGGRFPALPGRLDRQVRVFREVTGGATPTQNQQDCLTTQTGCPKSYGPNDDIPKGLVEAFCKASDPPKCLLANREEHVSFANFRNFEGALPIPPHALPYKLLLVVGDESSDFADDRDYTLVLEWRADPDDAARTSGGVEVPSTVSVPEVSPAGFPVPGAGAVQVSGTLAFGHGFLLDHDANRGEGVRGPLDYDAVVSDTDAYELLLPALPDAGFLDRSWALQWDVQNLDGGAPPFDLGLKVTFCDGSGAGACTAVNPVTLSYVSSALASWHNTGPTATPLQPVYDRASAGGFTTVTARAYGCFCIEPRFMKGGKFTMNVHAVDRSSYAPLQYRIRTALTDYPQSYPLAAGGTASCPAPIAEADGGSSGGCQFR